MTSSIPTTAGSARPAWEESLIGPPGLLAAFTWGLAEATFFFVIPDVLLSFIAILDWPRTWKNILAAICGALLGGALLFHWAKADFAQAHSAVLRVPFVRESMFAKVDEGFRDQGLLSVLLGSISGLPYKLYAVEAPNFTSASSFLLVTPPARAFRFLLVWAGFGAVARWLKKRRHWPLSRLVKIYAGLWIASYAFYWGRIILG